MRKTLLLVFIHGFKGGDDTFGTFPEHLRAIVSHALPKVNVQAVTYPKFETRGDLKECVGRFREWLQDRVIDIEVASKTPSPTIDPSVHVVLIGHSMGGIVAAETLLLLVSEQTIPHPSPANSTANAAASHEDIANTDEDVTALMFPHIQGIIAMDTPYLGIAPGVVAHGAEDHYRTASSAYGAISEVAGAFGWGSKSEPDLQTSKKPVAALPPATGDAAAVPSWQRWGRYAMFAGGAAVAATGAAALYSNRDRFTAGWSWVTSHLEFVGCLARGEELKQRIRNAEKETEKRGLGFANFYTVLGKGKRNDDVSLAKNVLTSTERTFCALPDKTTGTNGYMKWYKAINDKARFETGAHMSMFTPKDNPQYYELGTQARDNIAYWVDKGWYESSDSKAGEEAASLGGEPVTVPEGGEDEEPVVV